MTKPGDFLIGVLDFFAILLPGSMTTWLITRYLPSADLFQHLSFGPGKTEPDALTLWTAFLLSSYVLGHFVFMAGSRLDSSYDRWRRRVKPSSQDKTFQAADAVRKRLTSSLADSDFTTLKWAKVTLLTKATHVPSGRPAMDPPLLPDPVSRPARGTRRIALILMDVVHAVSLVGRFGPNDATPPGGEDAGVHVVPSLPRT